MNTFDKDELRRQKKTTSLSEIGYQVLPPVVELSASFSIMIPAYNQVASGSYTD
jgi:hypothetical protein